MQRFLPIDSHGPVDQLEHEVDVGVRANVENDVVARVDEAQQVAVPFRRLLGDVARVVRTRDFHRPGGGDVGLDVDEHGVQLEAQEPDELQEPPFHLFKMCS